MFAAGTPITVETLDSVIEGVLAEDTDSLDGIVMVRDESGLVRVRGWLFAGGATDDGTGIELFV
jgi:hypothetical protein